MSIRSATPRDLDEVLRLLESAGSAHEPRAYRRFGVRRRLLVVDAADGTGLAAAALLVVERERATLAFVVVERRYQPCGLEARLRAATRSLARALGARQVDALAHAA